MEVAHKCPEFILGHGALHPFSVEVVCHLRIWLLPRTKQMRKGQSNVLRLTVPPDNLLDVDIDPLSVIAHSKHAVSYTT